MYYAKPIQDNLLVLLKNYKSKPILNKINLKIPINHVNFYYIYIFIKKFELTCLFQFSPADSFLLNELDFILYFC